METMEKKIKNNKKCKCGECKCKKETSVLLPMPQIQTERKINKIDLPEKDFES